MNYEEFVSKGPEFYMEMVRLIDLKHRYRLEFTKQEKEINQHILTYSEEIKINELRDRFEKCWKKENLD